MIRKCVPLPSSKYGYTHLGYRMTSRSVLGGKKLGGALSRLECILDVLRKFYKKATVASQAPLFFSFLIYEEHPICTLTYT
jgi:hypothetical protein